MWHQTLTSLVQGACFLASAGNGSCRRFERQIASPECPRPSVGCPPTAAWHTLHEFELACRPLPCLCSEADSTRRSDKGLPPQQGCLDCQDSSQPALVQQVHRAGCRNPTPQGRSQGPGCSLSVLRGPAWPTVPRVAQKLGRRWSPWTGISCNASAKGLLERRFRKVKPPHGRAFNKAWTGTLQYCILGLTNPATAARHDVGYTVA